MKMRKDDAGVSSVVGAVLMFAVFISVLIMVQAEFTPIWDEEREARHADLVANQVGFIKAELDRQAAGTTGVPVTGHLDLRSEGGFSYFQQLAIGGEARFRPVGTEVVFEAPSITVQEVGGTSLLGVEETWETIQSGVSVGPIDHLLHLRVRVPNPHGDPAGIYSTLTLYDKDSNYAGKINIRNGDDAVYLSTFSKDSTTTPITNRLDDTDPDGPTFYFNLLDDNLLFDSIVAAATKPVTLQLEDGGLPADFTVVYDKVTATGTERVGADIGVTTLDYDFSVPSGALEVDISYDRYVDQQYILEHGAVILKQDQGAAMVAPPAFKATVGGIQHRVQWSIPTLQGTTSTVGTAQATVTMSAKEGGVTIDALLPSFEITLPTDHPGLWARFWDDTLKASGYSESAGEYAITLTSQSATLKLYGPVTDPASTTNDIVLDLRQAIVDTTVTPFG